MLSGAASKAGWRALLLAAAVVVIAWLPPAGGAAAQGGGLAYSVAVAGPIDQGSARALDRAIDVARDRDAAVVILRLDTPGGLLESARAMVRTIAAAPTPVIVYVHPSGGRADSAGLILTLAGDVAAMAPETNIGSATPFRDDPPPRTKSEAELRRILMRKYTNGFVAFARTLAEDHGRNADLTERMIRDAENVSARSARRERLIEVLAPTEQALLRSLDGFAVKGGKAQQLQTRDLQIERVDEAALLTAASEDLEDSSLWRSFAYVFGAAAVIVLTITAVSRARPAWRRWRRKRRRMKLQRR